MGLDVYLYYNPDLEDKIKRERDFKDLDLDYGTPEYTNASTSLGLVDGQDETSDKGIELDSAIDPEHMFKIGYFRSSYNNAGINTILENRLNKRGLYAVFEEASLDDYYVRPNWNNALDKIKELIEKFEADIEKKGKWSTYKVPDNPFKWPPEQGIDSEEAALNRFTEELEKQEGRLVRPFYGEGYSTLGDSYFLTKPLKVFAILGGYQRGYTVKDIPTYYLVTSVDHDWDWYITALKIVQETIEWVLAKPDPENYYFHWSG